MGKRLDDLNLSDSDGPGPRDEASAAEMRAWRLANKIEAMLLDERYQYAEDTLSGILETVRERKQVTDAQAQAVENIEEGGDRHAEAEEGWGRHERRTGRRYDGWNGRQR